MACVNYSVPNDVKEAFNIAFAGRNKSAIITGLMREAVQQELRRRMQAAAADAILRRGESPLTFVEELLQETTQVDE